jgi:hypothetical protein
MQKLIELTKVAQYLRTTGAGWNVSHLSYSFVYALAWCHAICTGMVPCNQPQPYVVVGRVIFLLYHTHVA